MNDFNVDITARLHNKVSRGAKHIKSDLRSIGNEADRLGNNRGINRATAALSKYRGAIIAASSAAIIGGVYAVGKGISFATSEAMDFDTALVEVRKASDLTDQQFAKLKRSILQTSAETGIAKENLAGLVAEAAKSGRPFAELTEFSLLAAKGAIAFGMSAEETSAAMSKMGNSLGLTLPQLVDLGDAINHVADNSASAERDIINFVNRTGSTAKVAGLAAEETVAFGAALLSIGVPAEVASTGFNAFLLKLSAADKQGKKFQSGLKELGMSAKELKAALEQDAPEALMHVLNKIDQLPDSEKLGVLSDMFGLEYADDIAKLAGSVELVGTSLGHVADQADRAGSLDKSFALFDEDTTQKVTKASVAFENFASRIGDKFTPAVGAAADASADFFNSLSAMLDKQKEVEAFQAKFADGGDLSTEEQEELAKNGDVAQAIQSERAKSRTSAQSELANIRRAQELQASGTNSKSASRLISKHLSGDVDARVKSLEDRIAQLSTVDKSTSRSELERQRSALQTQQWLMPETVRRGRKSIVNPGITENQRQIDQINQRLGTMKVDKGSDTNLSSIPIPISREDAMKTEVEVDIPAAKTAQAGKQIGDGATSSIQGQASVIGQAIGQAAAAEIQKASVNVKLSGANLRKQNRDIRSSKNAALHDTGAPN